MNRRRNSSFIVSAAKDFAGGHPNVGWAGFGIKMRPCAAISVGQWAYPPRIIWWDIDEVPTIGRIKPIVSRFCIADKLFWGCVLELGMYRGFAVRE